ncbi:MAG: N-acetylmuramic acid 6-phosphate etherase [Clostridia bacterium]|nr:N-acetylmuramic acid 6-phosphate etherase [Clostridia bacterium]
MNTKPKTEQRNPDTMHIDTMPTADILSILQNENKKAVNALDAALPQITEACEQIAKRMLRGGRLIYVGAGTSGRLGVLDAAECPPTFGVPRELVCGVIAGGEGCMFRASENAEDRAENGKADLEEKRINDFDCVVGISAAGNAAYVLGALEYAKSCGALTVGVTNNYGCKLEKTADITITADTGPEPITGSTRMKAGSAQKMILNMISTTVMIKLGYVYENLMINLRPSNEKLRRRVISIVCDIHNCDEETAVKLLETADWSIRGTL